MSLPVSLNLKNVSLLKPEQKIRPTITKDSDTIKTPHNSILHIRFGDIKNQKCFWFKDLKSFYCKDSLCKNRCVFFSKKKLVYFFSCFRILLAVALVSCLVPFVDARGRLLEPAQRSSLWRRGFKSPINRDDDGLNCGGYWVSYAWFLLYIIKS